LRENVSLTVEAMKMKKSAIPVKKLLANAVFAMALLLSFIDCFSAMFFTLMTGWFTFINSGKFR
jgi:hypothetical protein